MLTLSGFKFAAGRLFPCSVAACISCANAAVNLDKLTACEDIARIYELLKSDKNSLPEDCRPPSTELEEAVLSRSRLRPSELCFGRVSSVPLLKNFQCIRPNLIKQGAALICFRPASSVDIVFYKQQYTESFAAPVSRYLSSAAACKASNGDSSIAVSTLHPHFLAFISRFEFGFNLSLGTGRPSGSAMLHAYATVDPSISRNNTSALEVVSFLVGMEDYSPPGKKTIVGDWVVVVDDEGELEDGFNEAARRKGAPLRVNSTSYHFDRRSGPGIAQGTKIKMLENMQEKIVEALEIEGFEKISNTRIESSSGRSVSEIIEEISKTLPYGRRNMPVAIGKSLAVLMNEERPSCTSAGRGAIGAYVFIDEPVPGVKSNYGGIAFMLLGAGACSRNTVSSTRVYIDGLIEEITSQVFDDIKNR